MDRIRLRGGRPLEGEIAISGAKNAALKLMAASLLTDERLTLANVPHLARQLEVPHTGYGPRLRDQRVRPMDLVEVQDVHVKA